MAESASMSPLLDDSAPGAWLQAVEVEETPGSAARYESAQND